MSKRVDGSEIQVEAEDLPTPDPADVYRWDFKSLDEYADFAESKPICSGCWSGDFQGMSGRWDHDPGYSSSDQFKEIIRMAREGWRWPVERALNVTDKAVRMIETEINTFEPVHDVCGADVDIDAYLHGAPENMIEYPLQKTSNIGNVVTLCVDVQYGLNLSAKTIIDRGATIASLAILLERLGHQTELYVSDEYSLRSPISPVSAKWERVMYRVRVKGTKDFIDPAKIMFAYAHPGIQRGMGFTCAQDVRRNENEYGLSDGERYGYNRSSLLKPVPDTGPRMPGLGIQLHNSSFGPVTRTTRDLPEGTIYIDPLLRNTDAPNAELELRRFLMQLGLLREENE